MWLYPLLRGGAGAPIEKMECYRNSARPGRSETLLQQRSDLPRHAELRKREFFLIVVAPPPRRPSQEGIEPPSTSQLIHPHVLQPVAGGAKREPDRARRKAPF